MLQIGDEDNSGGIYVTDAVSFADAYNEVVHLVTGSGDITSDGSGSALQVAGLAITSGGTVDLDGYNQVGTLAVNHTGAEGSVTFTDVDGLDAELDGLVIGTVDDVDGVSAYGVTLSEGGALTDDGVNQITAEYLTVESASSIGEVFAGLKIDASDVYLTSNGNIVLEAAGEDGVEISAAVVGGEGGIGIYSTTEDVTLYDVSTEDGAIRVSVSDNLYAYDVVADGDSYGADGMILLALGDITVGDISADSDDTIAIGANGDIDFVGGGEGAVGGGNSTLTLAAVGDISFAADFGSAEDAIGTLNVASATNFTIETDVDVFTLDINDFNVSGTVDLGDTLVVLGENAFTINAGDIFGALTAENAASVTILATGLIGEVNDESDNTFVANTTGALNFNGGDVQGFAWLGELDGTTFVINGVTVVFEVLVDVEEVIDDIIIDTVAFEAEVDLSGPSALTSTSTFVADVFSVDFSLGTNLAVAPAAGGDGEGGDGEGGDGGGGDFLGNFWGSLIETAPDDSEEGGDTAGDDLFGDDDEDDEDDLVFDDE